MITLIALILRLALLAAFIFGFIVFLEHGADNFRQGAETEWTALKTYALGEATPTDDVPDLVEPEAEPTIEETTEPAPVPTIEPTPEPPVERIPEPTPPPMPSPTVAREQSAFEALQKQPLGQGINIPVAGKAGDPPPTSGVRQ